MLMRGVVVAEEVDRFLGVDLLLHMLEELQPLYVPVALPALAHDRSVQCIHGGEERRGPVALVIMRHGGATAFLQRQARL